MTGRVVSGGGAYSNEGILFFLLKNKGAALIIISNDGLDSR